MKSKVIQAALVILVVLIGFRLYSDDRSIQAQKGIGVDETHPFIMQYRNEFPSHTLLYAAEADLNADDAVDMVIVYNPQGDEKNYMTVLLRDREKYLRSQETLAPRENIDIQFKNIDEKNPTEFIVSGSKDGNYGYAIYRLENNSEIRDLFCEDMDSCC